MLPNQLWQVIWGFIWNTHWRKAKKCEYVFSRAGNLRRPLKLHNELHWRKMQPMQIWKIEQMQLAWICILPVMPFEDTFVKHTGEKPNKCNECDVPSCQAKNLTRHLNRHSGKKAKNTTNANMKNWTNATCVTSHSPVNVFLKQYAFQTKRSYAVVELA